ncbi:D-2-hydroxyacid dehydrogenase [Adhaeribacter rhizoryzae]|uniref:D-2-hydroxyacid dehydrogenase n=1 Tax=Adhaeribacter rhizoryzae TaxID=2607907 RepID=A0A5M6DBA8_9BACT|nr:D-2-hydroxyacid dehydrogenase [Adhaeribacter rhizoryzae]KAA5544831.1 D-2-hydroxyacid dehydrogenase [Adhaeribacter rhizoryzae]
MKIVFLDLKTMGEVPNLHLLEQHGNVTYYETTTPAEVPARIKEADIIIVNKVNLDKPALEAATNLKLICVAATGTNNIDKVAAAERGIVVKNVVDYSSASVAQLTFAMLLHLLHKLPYFDNYVKQGEYAQSEIFTHLNHPFREIKNKRFGIIGLGNIGRQVARIAEAFGAEVVYYSASGGNTNQPYQRLELEEFLRTSDIISIHEPLNEYTQNLLHYNRLQLLKPSAILINVGRGGIVNEADLVRALNENLLLAAGLDVFEQEPIEANNPFLNIQHKEKLVLTPHIAWASVEARTLLVEKLAQNIQTFLQEGK